MTGLRSSFNDMVLMEASLRRASAFSAWPHSMMARLLLASHVAHHHPSEEISNELEQTPRTFLIASGQVMVSRVTELGEQSPFLLLGADSLAGVTQIFAKKNRVVYAFGAHTEVVAIHFPTLLLIELLDSFPMHWRSMTLMLVGQHGTYAQSLRSQTAGSLQQQVALTVNRLAQLYGVAISGGASVRVRISQAELAMLLHATRQAVNRQLKKIAASGAISLEYQGLVVVDPKMLRDIGSARS
jgi:CRP/FNR family transcriptional regulator, cyclic AMP receptor protein